MSEYEIVSNFVYYLLAFMLCFLFPLMVVLFDLLVAWLYHRSSGFLHYLGSYFLRLVIILFCMEKEVHLLSDLITSFQSFSELCKSHGSTVLEVFGRFLF